MTRPRRASGVVSCSAVLQPVEKMIWKQPSTASTPTATAKWPTSARTMTPAQRVAPEPARRDSRGRPRRSSATPNAPTMAPAPSDDISSPNPRASSFSTSRAMSGTTTLKLSASRLTTTSRPSVKATGGVAAA